MGRREDDGSGVDGAVSDAGVVERSETLSQPCSVWQELRDWKCLTGRQPVGNRNTAIPLDGGVSAAGRRFRYFVDTGEMHMFDLSRRSRRGDKFGYPLWGRVGIENTDQDGSIECRVCSEPLVDVAVTAESHLSLISVGELRCHSNPHGG
jgi:hypothetical protein